MADGFGMSGGGNVQAGTIFVGVKIQDVEKALAQMKGLETQAKTTGKELQAGAKTMGDAWKETAKVLSTVLAAVYGLHQAWRQFNEYAREQTAINRAVLALRQAGIASADFRDRLIEVGHEFIRFGQREQSAYDGFTRFVRATGSSAESWKLLDLAMRFAAATGEDAQTIIQAMTSAYQGQEMGLRRLLFRYGAGTDEIASWSEAMEAMTVVADTATEVLSSQETAINSLRAAWDEFADVLTGRVSPAIESTLQSLTMLLNHPELWAYLGQPGGIGMMMTASYQDYFRKKYPGWTPASVPDWISERTKRKPRPWGTGGGSEAKEPFDWEASQGHYAYQNEQSMIRQLRDMNEDGGMLHNVRELAGILASFATDLPQGIDTAWQNLTNNLLSMFQRIAAAALEAWLMARLLAAMGGGTPYYKEPGFVGPPGTAGSYGAGGGGFGGARPLGGGAGITISFTGSGGDILAEVWRGSSQIAKRQVAKGILVEGGRFAVASS
jgi:hypothetical protein